MVTAPGDDTIDTTDETDNDDDLGKDPGTNVSKTALRVSGDDGRNDTNTSSDTDTRTPFIY